jgi:hypothetical protein
VRAQLQRARTEGITFLSSAREGTGLWRDYPAVGGGSDEWVPAYIGTAVATVQDPRARALAAQTWTALRRQSWWSAGWGYMRRHPADADSTAWTLRLAESLGVRRSLRMWRAYRFLASHRRADGGVATFAVPGPMKAYTRLTTRFDGWCSSHECVSAVVARLERLPRRRDLLSYLRAQQRADGAWVGYWWFDREYSTAHAVEAFAIHGDRQDGARVRRAVEWVLASQGSDGVVRNEAAPHGSCFATALRVQILQFAGADPCTRDEAARSVAWLLEQQRPDGGWPGSAWLRFPPTDCVDVDRHASWHLGQLVPGGVMVDSRGLLTTATVLAALDRFARSLREPHVEYQLSRTTAA